MIARAARGALPLSIPDSDEWPIVDLVPRLNGRGESVVAARASLFVAALLAPFSCGGDSGKSGPPGLQPVPGAPKGQGPTVASVSTPDGVSGDVAIDVAVTGARGGPLAVALEVSRDGGRTFRPGAASLGDARLPDGHVALVWHSLRDVGFRSHDPVHLRLTASDGQGPGPPAAFVTPAMDNLRAAARHVDSYVVNYGGWSPDSVAIAKTVQLAIVHPKRGDVTRDLVASIQKGVSSDDPTDDVLVLCYVSVGEDMRTH